MKEQKSLFEGIKSLSTVGWKKFPFFIFTHWLIIINDCDDNQEIRRRYRNLKDWVAEGGGWDNPKNKMGN